MRASVVIATLLSFSTLAGAVYGADVPPPNLIAAIRTAAGPTGLSDGAKYGLHLVDLNGDGKEEAIVHLVDAGYCGSGGCLTIVLTRQGQSWRKIGRITVSNLPIYALSTRHSGWRDLGVTIGGGGTKNGLVALPFGRDRYASNPTVAPARRTSAKGATLIIGPDYDKLIPIPAR